MMMLWIALDSVLTCQVVAWSAALASWRGQWDSLLLVRDFGLASFVAGVTVFSLNLRVDDLLVSLLVFAVLSLGVSVWVLYLLWRSE